MSNKNISITEAELKELIQGIDDKYIRISCGFDALDASTIKGIKTNYYGKEALNVNLSINACQ